MNQKPRAAGLQAVGWDATGSLRRVLSQGLHQRPVSHLVIGLCVGQVLCWGLAFGLTYKSPEIDSAEQFVWAFSLQNGYWKHPPLPSWIMHGFIALFGPSVALPFVATQACIVIALALMWKLGCEFMSPRRSLIAMALTSLVTYHNIGGDSFNHNTALLPFQAATALLFYRATRSGTREAWALVGLFAGLAMLVKYVALVPLLGMLLYVACDRQLHRRQHLSGLLWAAAVFAVVMLPHALWLQSSHFLPFRYANSVAQALPSVPAALHSLADFLLMQGVRVLPFAVGLWFVFAPAGAPQRAFEPAVARPAAARRDALFLCIVGLAPLAFPVLMGLVKQTELQSRWGTNAFLFTGWLVLALWRRPDTERSLQRTLRFVVAAHVVLCLGMTLAKTTVAEHLKVRTRANFPGAVLAREAQATWQAHTEAPLRLVVSDIWLGGNIIAHSSQRVAVLIDGHSFKSPWVKDRAVESCGALVLDDLTVDASGHAEPNPALDALMARASFTGTWALPWANASGPGPRGATGAVRWGIIVPQRPQGCAEP